MPFVLVHGALLWKLAIVAAVGLVFGVIAIVRRFDARYWILATVRSFDITTHERVIRGVLGGGGATSHGDTHTRAPEMWIDTDEGRFALAGAIRVLAGSRARGRFVAVAPGDRVIAHGTITRAPGPAAHYRADSTTFTLTADGSAPILLAGRVPAIGVTPPSWAAILWATAVTIGVSLGALSAAGAYWHEACADSDGDALTNTNACVLASATPDRDDTLLLAQTTRRFSRDHLAVVEYLGDCGRLPDALVDAEAWDELADLAVRCDAPGDRQRALAELGRFDEAAALGHTHSGVSLGILYLLAHRWDDAAAQAERSASETRDDLARAHWACLGRLLRAYAADPGAFPDQTRCVEMRREAGYFKGEWVEPSHAAERIAAAKAHVMTSHSTDPLVVVRNALIAARYDAVLADRRVQLALSQWD